MLYMNLLDTGYASYQVGWSQGVCARFMKEFHDLENVAIRFTKADADDDKADKADADKADAADDKADADKADASSSSEAKRPCNKRPAAGPPTARPPVATPSVQHLIQLHQLLSPMYV